MAIERGIYQTMTQKAAKEHFQNMLISRPNAVTRAVLAIYKRQTDAEKSTKMTQNLNGVGFSAFDAEILSSFAERLLRGLPLTPKQMEIATKKMVRYWKQLWAIAKGGA